MGEDVISFADLNLYHRMPKKKFKVGIIGTGFVMDTYEMPGYRRAGFDIVAACDVDTRRLDRFRKKWDVPQGFADYREMIEMESLDVVEISVDKTARVPIIKDVAGAGKHILVQKPFAANFRDARIMTEAAEKGGVQLVVSQQYRWMHIYRAAHELVRRGYIGRPYYYLLEMQCNQDHDYFVNPLRQWNVGIDDFVTGEWGSHNYDLLRFWTGREPVSVYCNMSKMPGQNFKSKMIATCALEYDEHLSGGMTLVHTTRGDIFQQGFRIEGTEGVIRGSNYLYLEVCSRKYSKDFPGLITAKLKVEGDFNENRDWLYDDYVNIMAEFLCALEQGQTPSCNARDNMETVRCYEAGKLSQEEKRKVLVAEIR